MVVLSDKGSIAMEIIIFLVGFILGISVMFILQKYGKKSNDEMVNQMQLQFENLTNRIFKETSQDFSNQNKEKLEEFWERFREKIEEFQQKTDRNFREELENFTKFDANIKTFIEAGSKISHDTNSLVNVMKGDNRQQGRWGEIVLEKVLEASGLRNGEEFELQKGSAEGRPDAIINLPEGRHIFIDAKNSFASYYSYINAESEEEKDIYLKEFKASVKAHISGLSKRDYSSEFSSPDYVLMFIPIESCY
jgi:DNA recombination protein RmuC